MPSPGHGQHVDYQLGVPGDENVYKQKQDGLFYGLDSPDQHLTQSENNVMQIVDLDYIDDFTPADSPGVCVNPVFDMNAVKASVIAQRQFTWPRLTEAAARNNALKIYALCRDSASYNSVGPRISITTGNNIHAWKGMSTGHPDDAWLIEGIEFGFPMQYNGPPLYNEFVKNHPSATNYQAHVEDYINSEIALGAILGPFDDVPFQPWCNTAPLMTREKANGIDRRIIVDLSFPPGRGPNAFVNRNTVFGIELTHTLPTINDAVNIITSLDFNVALGSIDIARAYRNFILDPLDWPLTCMQHDGKFYVDRAMPFGSRISSVYMQRMALFIQRALLVRGILTVVYLDDVLLILKRHENPDGIFVQARDLIMELGLPIAWDKIVTPTRCLKFLGIFLDLDKKEIRMPEEKIRKFADLARHTYNKRIVSVKTVQSIAGHINHLSKAVRPARLFLNRILEALRNAEKGPVKVDRQFKADLQWFLTFLPAFNGRTLILSPDPTVVIEADSSLVGGGAYMDKWCYAYRYPSDIVAHFHISQLEALNCLIAARVFLTYHHDECVRIVCDNQGAIASLSSGKGRDSVITSVCRAFWFFAAKRNIHFIFTHAPGESMIVADALSRQYSSEAEYYKAQNLAYRLGLKYVNVDDRYADLDVFL